MIKKKEKKLFIVLVNNKFVDQLDFLTKQIYGGDYSRTLTLIIKEICNDDNKFNDFMTYYKKMGNSIDTEGVTHSSMQKSYKIGTEEYATLNNKRGDTPRAKFLRALVSYVYNNHRTHIPISVEYDLIEKIEKATKLKVIDKNYIGGNLNVTLDITPIKK